MRLLLALLIISLECLSHAAEEKEGPIRLATAPSGEYAVDWTAPDGPPRVVSKSDGAVIAELKFQSRSKAPVTIPWRLRFLLSHPTATGCLL